MRRAVLGQQQADWGGLSKMTLSLKGSVRVGSEKVGK